MPSDSVYIELNCPGCGKPQRAVRRQELSGGTVAVTDEQTQAWCTVECYNVHAAGTDRPLYYRAESCN